MSGIVGIFNLDGGPVDPLLLTSMTKSMAYRGPDAQRTWNSGPVGLGNAAFYTLPESPDWPQPLALGELMITGDIRLDGIQRLIESLSSAGCNIPRGADDALLVLYAYQAWGKDCVERIAGDFCFAIWDAHERTLFCARDQIGVRPFFYALQHNTFVFSNTLDCVRRHPVVSDRLNDATVADFLMSGWLQEPTQTFFADIQRLPAAHAIHVSPGGIRIVNYWRPPSKPTRHGGRASTYAEEFAALLRQSVSERVRTPKVGVLLSGGMDSTSVAAIAHSPTNGAVPSMAAATAGYDRLFPDEEPRWAKRVADALGIPWLYVAGDDFRLFETYAHPDIPTPEPIGDPVRMIMSELLARLAAHGRTSLTGEGGDVILGVSTVGHGFNWRHLPGTFEYMLACRRLPIIGLRNALRERFRGRKQVPPYPKWLNPDLERALDLPARWQELHQDEPVIHPTRPVFFQRLTSPFWSFSFEEFDPGCTGRQVQVMHPLMSVGLVEFTFSIPVHSSNFVDKGLLRRAMQGMIPEDVRRRPKRPLPVNVVRLQLRARRWDRVCDLPPSPELMRFLKPNTPVTWSGSLEDEPTGWDRVPLVSLNCWLRAGYPRV
jgi:asparagine synthase (glutamine-hydrolysing)